MHIHGNPPSRGKDKDGPQRVAEPWQLTTTATGMATPMADHDLQPQRHRSIGNLPDQENAGHQKPHLELLLRRITDEAEKRRRVRSLPLKGSHTQLKKKGTQNEEERNREDRCKERKEGTTEKENTVKHKKPRSSEEQ